MGHGAPPPPPPMGSRGSLPAPGRAGKVDPSRVSSASMRDDGGSPVAASDGCGDLPRSGPRSVGPPSAAQPARRPGNPASRSGGPASTSGTSRRGARNDRKSRETRAPSPRVPGRSSKSGLRWSWMALRTWNTRGVVQGIGVGAPIPTSPSYAAPPARRGSVPGRRHRPAVTGSARAGWLSSPPPGGPTRTGRGSRTSMILRARSIVAGDPLDSSSATPRTSAGTPPTVACATGWSSKSAARLIPSPSAMRERERRDATVRPFSSREIDSGGMPEASESASKVKHWFVRKSRMRLPMR